MQRMVLLLQVSEAIFDVVQSGVHVGLGSDRLACGWEWHVWRVLLTLILMVGSVGSFTFLFHTLKFLD